jgi:hypothetical protein
MGRNTEGRSVRNSEHTQRKQPGILRFEFPKARNRNDDKLQEISWEEFFKKFDESDLELLYQEKTVDGGQSNFNRLIRPESEEHSRHKSPARAVAAESIGQPDLGK